MGQKSSWFRAEPSSSPRQSKPMEAIPGRSMPLPFDLLQFRPILALKGSRRGLMFPNTDPLRVGLERWLFFPFASSLNIYPVFQGCPTEPGPPVLPCSQACLSPGGPLCSLIDASSLSWCSIRLFFPSSNMLCSLLLL